jgi:hypothetical protein
MGVGVPILFLIFNRPELTRKAFEAIRRQRPERLYVAADGPRSAKKGEWQRCLETRKIIEEVDWPCDLKTRFQDQNLGCGRAVSSSITWFFENEEEGIILEDDCLPSSSFFQFCADLLVRFRDNPAVGTISGDSFFPGSLRHPDPYFFSKYVQIWGWATWRRTWQNYELDLLGSQGDWEHIIRDHCPVELEAKYWLEIYKALKSGQIDTWDYQLMFTCWKHSQVHIAPTRNLVENLGYGADATHTIYESLLAENKAEEISDYQLTLPVKLDHQLDQAVMYFRFLECLNNTWWLHQAVDISEKLGWARWQAQQAEKEMKVLEKASAENAEAVRWILESRHASRYKFEFGTFVLSAAHKVWNAISSSLAKRRDQRSRAGQTVTKPPQKNCDPQVLAETRRNAAASPKSDFQRSSSFRK